MARLVIWDVIEPIMTSLYSTTFNVLPHTYDLFFLSLYSRSHTTTYNQISQSLEDTRYWLRELRSFWHLTTFSVALLLRRLSDIRIIRLFQQIISYDDETPAHLENRGPGFLFTKMTPPYGYMNPHYNPKMVWWPSHLKMEIIIPVKRCLLSEWRPRTKMTGSLQTQIHH